MKSLWDESKEASPMTRAPIRAMTRDRFFALLEEERGKLLQNFLIIKDTSVSEDFLPQFSVPICALSSTAHQTLYRPITPPPPASQGAPAGGGGRSSAIEVTDEMPSAPE